MLSSVWLHQIRPERRRLSANNFLNFRKCQWLTGIVLGLACSGGWWDFVIEYCTCDSLISCPWPEYSAAIFLPTKFISDGRFSPKYSPSILLVNPDWNINVLKGGLFFDRWWRKSSALCFTLLHIFVLISHLFLPLNRAEGSVWRCKWFIWSHSSAAGSLNIYSCQLVVRCRALQK